jgi:hypothetical protein
MLNGSPRNGLPFSFPENSRKAFALKGFSGVRASDRFISLHSSMRPNEPYFCLVWSEQHNCQRTSRLLRGSVARLFKPTNFVLLFFNSTGLRSHSCSRWYAAKFVRYLSRAWLSARGRNWCQGWLMNESVKSCEWREMNDKCIRNANRKPKSAY